jgi:hypothetical protein
MGNVIESRFQFAVAAIGLLTAVAAAQGLPPTAGKAIHQPAVSSKNQKS